jgi:hypothetical protein
MGVVHFPTGVFTESPPKSFTESPVLGDREEAGISLSEVIVKYGMKYSWLDPNGFIIDPFGTPDNDILYADDTDGSTASGGLTEDQIHDLKYNADGTLRLFGAKWIRINITPDPGSTEFPYTGTYGSTNESDPDTITRYEGVAHYGTLAVTGIGGGNIRLGAVRLSGGNVVLTDEGGAVTMSRTTVVGVPDGAGGYSVIFTESITKTWYDERSLADYRAEALSILPAAPWGMAATKLDDGRVVTWLDEDFPGNGAAPYTETGFGFAPQGGFNMQAWFALQIMVQARDWHFKDYFFNADGDLISQSDMSQEEHFDATTPMEFYPADSDSLVWRQPKITNP